MVYPLSLLYTVLVQVVSLTFGVGVGYLSCTPPTLPRCSQGPFHLYRSGVLPYGVPSQYRQGWTPLPEGL